MAGLISLSVYNLDNQQDVPLANVQRVDFPAAGILVSGLGTNGQGQTLSTGIVVYSSIQLNVHNGRKYLVIETPAAIAALS
jgi:hypothetical protein